MDHSFCYIKIGTDVDLLRAARLDSVGEGEDGINNRE
jgi:hypothetical protein